MPPMPTLSTPRPVPGMRPQYLPDEFQRLSDDEAVARIPAVRRALGSRVVVLGHHYQRDDVIQFADHTGDSYGLATKAAANREAGAIVFCGVHFMAESADILSREDQVVLLPDHEAGCSLADMADLDQVEVAWDELTAICGDEALMPVTYINSGADLKAFVGENGGTVCTSSNAAAAFDWSAARRDKVFFFPDQHLGRNTALARGVPEDRILLWDPLEHLGGNDEAAIRRGRVVLWKGHCSVHTRFRPEHVVAFREQVPGIRILVHPECTREVVDLADLVGSTSFIIRQVEEAAPGTKWAIGTELHLVNRLRLRHPEQQITSLVPGVCLCATRNRIAPQHLLWVLERRRDGETVNRVQVPPAIAAGARLALDRMLAIR